jgi:hypothetical protein
VREHGIKDSPSTEIELQRAAEAALATVAWLRAAGVPDTCIGVMCSGNGYWVLVRCLLSAGSHGQAIMKALLARWKAALEDASVMSLDAGNFDPRRVGPFLGLTKRKGVESTDRPYRRSYWIAGEGSAALSARDVQTLLTRCGGEVPLPQARSAGPYHRTLTEETLDEIGFGRVFHTLRLSPSHCQWCGHTAGPDSSTLKMLGNLQSCLRGTCRSMGHNQRPLARVVSMKLFGNDRWRDHETEIRAWITTNFGYRFPDEEDLCCL